jgi:hypothetical protein
VNENINRLENFERYKLKGYDISSMLKYISNKKILISKESVPEIDKLIRLSEKVMVTKPEMF